MASPRKVCKECRRRRSLSSFRELKFKRQNDYLWHLPYCRDCEKRRQFAVNLGRYGLTVEEYARMERAQEYACAICRDSLEGVRTNVDHCHTEGHVRGLLCGHCNKGIGHLRDDVTVLASAIEYLEAA